MLYCWGRNSDGQCGPADATLPNAPNVALPRHIPLPEPCSLVACGTGQQGCTFVVTASGALFTFGNNSGGRLGHEGLSDREKLSVPRRVEGELSGRRIASVACADSHALAAADDGTLFSWGRDRSVGGRVRGILGLRAPRQAWRGSALA